MFRSVAFILVVGVGLGACETQRRPSAGGSRPGCVTGQSIPCACSNGLTGAQICENLAYGACICTGDAAVADGSSESPDAGASFFDANEGFPDSSEPARDAGFLDLGFPDFGFPDAQPRDFGVRDSGVRDAEPSDVELIGLDAHAFGDMCGGCNSNTDCPNGYECMTHPLLGSTMCLEPCGLTGGCMNPNDTCLFIFCSSCLF